MVSRMKRVSFFLSSLLLSATLCSSGRLIETERVEEYHARNYTWPPKFVPSTEGWERLMRRRFLQAERVPKISNDRYNAWLFTVNAAYVAPNFTETGWGLTRAPDDLMEALRNGIREGLPKARPEGDVDVIEGDQAIFIDRPDLTARVLNELKPMHEAWSGVKLKPQLAYGFRLYRNQSSLLMHIDRPNTHVISCILHIDSSEDAEPWPIVIEDYQGNTNEVILQSGDMLFYESSKCFHGRPKKFNGSWYSSIFVHYSPVEGWPDTDHELEMHYAVPPQWNSPAPEPNEEDPERLVMRGTSMKEPDCDGEWCALANTVKWFGPAKKDYVLTSGGKSYPLSPSQRNDEL